MIEYDATQNMDHDTVTGFGEEWSKFDQSKLSEDELLSLFERYFRIFPFDTLPPDAEGFDLGCGSGRWAQRVAPRVGQLHCIDPADKALTVARRNLAGIANVDFFLASAHDMPLDEESQDFGYSLGVLHHIPDTERALSDCVRKLKPGAPFLVYLYYNFDNRPLWFRLIWMASDRARKVISRLPSPLRSAAAELLALSVYYPLARGSKFLDKIGVDVENMPLSSYRNLSFYTMRTDALDRFGTKLEQRYSRADIAAMMQRSGLGSIVFNDDTPYWVACGVKPA